MSTRTQTARRELTNSGVDIARSTMTSTRAIGCDTASLALVLFDILCRYKTPYLDNCSSSKQKTYEVYDQFKNHVCLTVVTIKNKGILNDLNIM